MTKVTELDERYLVVKHDDLENALGFNDKKALQSILLKVQSYRRSIGKKPTAEGYIVINKQWSCFGECEALILDEINNSLGKWGDNTK